MANPPTGKLSADGGGPGSFGRGVVSGLTRGQRVRLTGWLAEVHASEGWQGSLPVALLDRCWLRLWAVPVHHLARELPPDASGDAPELVRYRELLGAGRSSWQAELLCRRDFGNEAWREALRHHWRQSEEQPHQWTLNRYLELLRHYRQQVSGPERQLPLVVLGRSGSREPHRVLWLQGSRQSMRHTCA